jgi:biofilm PGA synthesis lipoprotein PgaB
MIFRSFLGDAPPASHTPPRPGVRRAAFRAAGVFVFLFVSSLLIVPPALSEEAGARPARPDVVVAEAANRGVSTATAGIFSRRPDLPAEPIRGVQVLVFESENLEGLIEEMATIKDLGCNTVIVRVFHNNGDRFYPFAEPKADAGVYFKTDHMPVVDDVLGTMIAAARANDLSIFAWMTTRYAVCGDERFGLLEYDFATGSLVPAFGVNLFSDHEVERLVGLYRDLAAYAIDGVLFQDDLVLKHAEGMGPDAERLYGRPIEPETFYIDPYLNNAGTKYYVHGYTDAFYDWAAFKSRRLGNVIKEIIDGVRRDRPDMLFCVNLSYEAVLRPDLALAWLSQDLGEFERAGADYFFIMAYQRQMMAEMGLSDLSELAPKYRELCESGVFMVGDPSRLVIKPQLIDWETGRAVTGAELLTLSSFLYKRERIGIVLVPYRDDAPLDEARRLLTGE